MSRIPFLTIQEFSASCLNAPTTASITQRFTQILHDTGVSEWFVGSLANVDDVHRPGFGFYGELRAWQNHYHDAQLYRHDPVYAYAKHGSRPIVWSECRQQELSKPALQVFGDASAFRLNAGYIMPVHGFGDLPGAVTFGGDDPDLSLESRMSFFLLGAYAYEGLRRLSERFRRVPPILTKRELEVLRWSAEGKSAWDIGVILTIGETTVRTYQASIRRKYGVPSIIQAAVLAALDGTLGFGMSTHQI